jgi:hypothetical protein
MWKALSISERPIRLLLKCSGFRVHGLGFRVWGLGFRVVC